MREGEGDRERETKRGDGSKGGRWASTERQRGREVERQRGAPEERRGREEGGKESVAQSIDGASPTCHQSALPSLHARASFFATPSSPARPPPSTPPSPHGGLVAATQFRQRQLQRRRPRVWMRAEKGRTPSIRSRIVTHTHTHTHTHSDCPGGLSPGGLRRLLTC